ncbi:MAG: 16S rRNA (guanine(966)-N(2))-methyltransferase RsmD [Candidatus Thioglobus sp.]|nr:16S rRNA (guanine(966)-N(2))-methyltransferase RsmD [Candidatus Thioglobus sp.]
MRPTSGKIRETLFNWISFEAEQKTYLDLFAGSGALSFEALSRGAKSVIGVEKNLSAYQALEQNQQILNTQKIQFFCQDALEFLAKKSQNYFDFVFLDPPFHQNILPKALKLLANNDFVTHGSKIYIESEAEILLMEICDFFADEISLIQQKKSGQVHYCLLEIL